MTYYSNTNDDCVNGQIVGEVHSVCCCLFYNGKPQSKKMWFINKPEADDTLTRIMQKLKQENKGICYLDPSLWEFRFY